MSREYHLKLSQIENLINLAGGELIHRISKDLTKEKQKISVAIVGKETEESKK
jgi:hypothetical protein